jgi:hypothetical protein
MKMINKRGKDNANKIFFMFLPFYNVKETDDLWINPSLTRGNGVHHCNSKILSLDKVYQKTCKKRSDALYVSFSGFEL